MLRQGDRALCRSVEAIEILGDTRRRLYGLLAEGPENTEDESLEEE